MVFFSKLGRTIPEDVLNPYSLSAEGVTSNDNLSPAIFAINKSTGEVFMFEVRHIVNSTLEAHLSKCLSDQNV